MELWQNLGIYFQERYSKFHPMYSSIGPTFDGRIKPEVCGYGVNNYVAGGSKESYMRVSGTSLSAPWIAGISKYRLAVSNL
jgi:serine protease AprX